MTSPQINPPCARCGGPHPFDTTVPSVRWNEVIRANGWVDYLCLTCIVTAFAALSARRSFTATLWSGRFDGLEIEVRIGGAVAIDAAALSRDNTELRHALDELVHLQAHYAELLNMRDGGQRHAFATADEWLARLRELQEK